MAVSRVLPHNLEAEQSVLGCVLMDQELQSELLTELKEGDFYNESHKTIFNAMCEIYNQSKPVDLITLCDKLDGDGKLEQVGGISYVTDLTGVIPSTANYRSYFDIVRRDGILRAFIRSANKILEDCYGSSDSDASLSLAEKSIYDISAENDTSTLSLLSEKLGDVLHKFEEIGKDSNAFAGLKSGFIEMDKFTNGFRRGNLIILAARPSNGKTTLAMNIVENAAIQSDAVCAVFALEMTKEELAQRMLCSISGVDNGRAIRGQIDEEGWQKLWAARKKLSDRKIFVDDTSITTPGEILSKCRRLKSKQGRLDLIVVDHIQLMEVQKGGTKRGDNRQQEITQISRNLKMIAKELDVPVIALSQLSRLVTNRTGQKPVLSDLRESGAIEQDADIVMFIHRPDKVAEESEIAKGKVMKNVAEILIEKNRAGSTGSFELLFKGGNTKFVDLPKDYKSQFETVQTGGGRDMPPAPEDIDDAPFDPDNATSFAPPEDEGTFTPPDDVFDASELFEKMPKGERGSTEQNGDNDIKVGQTDINDIF
ncbi:MAG: replicative DNA helicase [bacterium]|nr:replicative DNA helicase [bacterium]